MPRINSVFRLISLFENDFLENWKPFEYPDVDRISREEADMVYHNEQELSDIYGSFLATNYDYDVESISDYLLNGPMTSFLRAIIYMSFAKLFAYYDRISNEEEKIPQEIIDSMVIYLRGQELEEQKVMEGQSRLITTDPSFEYLGDAMFDNIGEDIIFSYAIREVMDPIYHMLVQYAADDGLKRKSKDEIVKGLKYSMPDEFFISIAYMFAAIDFKDEEKGRLENILETAEILASKYQHRPNLDFLDEILEEDEDSEPGSEEDLPSPPRRSGSRGSTPRVITAEQVRSAGLGGIVTRSPDRVSLARSRRRTPESPYEAEDVIESPRTFYARRRLDEPHNEHLRQRLNGNNFEPERNDALWYDEDNFGSEGEDRPALAPPVWTSQRVASTPPRDPVLRDVPHIIPAERYPVIPAFSGSPRYSPGRPIYEPPRTPSPEPPAWREDEPQPARRVLSVSSFGSVSRSPDSMISSPSSRGQRSRPASPPPIIRATNPPPRSVRFEGSGSPLPPRTIRFAEPDSPPPPRPARPPRSVIRPAPPNLSLSVVNIPEAED